MAKHETPWRPYWFDGLGIYKVQWKDGAWSPASIGADSAGVLWIAPPNWVRTALLTPRLGIIQGELLLRWDEYAESSDDTRQEEGAGAVTKSERELFALMEKATEAQRSANEVRKSVVALLERLGAL